MNEEMEKIYNQLTEENKNIINMVAKGMQIAEQNCNINIKEENK